jgi:hypothetical protein
MIERRRRRGAIVLLPLLLLVGGGGDVVSVEGKKSTADCIPPTANHDGRLGGQRNHGLRRIESPSPSASPSSSSAAHAVILSHPSRMDLCSSIKASLCRRLLPFTRQQRLGRQLLLVSKTTDDSNLVVAAASKTTTKVQSSTTTNTITHKYNATESRILVYIRLLFLCYYASLGALMPYLPVYYESIGHGGKIIGLLGAVKPAT